MKKIKIGLKVWSSNHNYIAVAADVIRQGFCEYIELFVDPKSGEKEMCDWRQLDADFILHAPHSNAGLNPSIKEQESENRELMARVDIFNRGLTPEKIIFHPGVEGDLDEVIRQFKMFQKEFPLLCSKMLIENKPKLGISGETCIGATKGELQKLISELNCGFCFDMGHALLYANWAKKEWEDVFAEFLLLKPSMFHLSDGDRKTLYDDHFNLGTGSYDLKKMIAMIPDGSYVSIETKKRSKDNLNDFIEDVKYLRELLKNEN